MSYNAPGVVARADRRAPAILRENRVRPRHLGHVVIGSRDQVATRDFFVEAIGFKVSDELPNLASFLHHTAWQVNDVDEVGRGATMMIEKDPGRHAWGLGRHHIGSNFFWYLRDPAGKFSEYYADMDCVVDDALWKPEVWDGARGLYNWGPPVPENFVEPADLPQLAELAARASAGHDR